MKMKTEHKVVIGIAGLGLVYLGYDYMQTQKTNQEAANYAQQTQNQAQNQANTGTGTKVNEVVKDAKSVLDLFSNLPINLTNKKKQECIDEGGKWNGNGLFKKGFCVPKGIETENITRGTEPNHRFAPQVDENATKAYNNMMFPDSFGAPPPVGVMGLGMLVTHDGKMI